MICIARAKYRVILRGLQRPVELFSTISKGKLVKKVALLRVEDNPQLYVQTYRGCYAVAVQPYKTWRRYHEV